MPVRINTLELFDFLKYVIETTPTLAGISYITTNAIMYNSVSGKLYMMTGVEGDTNLVGFYVYNDIKNMFELLSSRPKGNFSKLSLCHSDSPNIMMAMGSNKNEVYYTSNGWQTSEEISGIDYSTKCIGYGNGLFVVGSNYNKTAWKINQSTKAVTSVSLPFNSNNIIPNSIAFGNSLYAILGYTSTDTNPSQILFSTNMSTFTSVLLPSSGRSITFCEYDNRFYVACATGIYSTSDGSDIRLEFEQLLYSQSHSRWYTRGTALVYQCNSTTSGQGTAYMAYKFFEEQSKGLPIEKGGTGAAELTGAKINLDIPKILQDIGNSPNNVMSQKAITDVINVRVPIPPEESNYILKSINGQTLWVSEEA